MTGPKPGDYFRWHVTKMLDGLESREANVAALEAELKSGKCISPMHWSDLIVQKKIAIEADKEIMRILMSLANVYDSSVE
jgi:hypothetical protein